MNTAKKVLDIAVSVAILVVCAMICWSYATHKSISFDGATAGQVTGGESNRLRGVSLPSLTGYQWSGHRETLLLAVRSGCHYCQDSRTFYARLKQMESSGELNAHLLAVLPDDKDSGTAFLRSGNAEIEAVFDQPLNNIQVLGTPTILLVDSHGTVVREWVGRLSRDAEEAVIKAARG